MFFRKNKNSKRCNKKVENKKVSILICSPNFESDLAKSCMKSVREFTKGFEYELILIENGKFGSFNHASEINRGLDIARGQYFVTLDDDVEVTEGWLDSMLALAEPDVGAVGCVNLNLQDSHRGVVRHVGGFVRGDGTVYQHNKEDGRVIQTPYVCSSCMLILDRGIRFPEFYSKYYHEAHFCLDNWKNGKKVLVSPHQIYHYGGGTMEYLGHTREKINEISENDRIKFVDYWKQGNQLNKLYKKIKNDIHFPID